MERVFLRVVQERSPYWVIGRTGPKGRDAAIHTHSVTVRSAAKARPGNRPPPCPYDGLCVGVAHRTVCWPSRWVVV